jgi:hypothetical protein
MKALIKPVLKPLLALAAAIAVSAAASSHAGTFVTMRDFTAPRDAVYDQMVLKLSARKPPELKTCRSETCPVRRGERPTTKQAGEARVPFFGGLRLLPR